MPVTVTFDISGESVKDHRDRHRIQIAFLRFGWEHAGGSAWRYPALGMPHASEDWFNHVIPALMYFRSIVEHSGMVVTRFTIDAHSEAGYRANTADGDLIGHPIAPGSQIQMCLRDLQPYHDNALSEARLKQFVTNAAESLA